MRRIMTHIQQFCLSGLLVFGLALSVFVLHSTEAFAQAPCSLTTPITVPDTPPGASNDCTMTITETVASGGLTLANDATATVTPTNIVLNGANHTATFSFTSIVADYRGSTAGWRLETALTGETLTPPGGTAAPVTPGSVSLDTGTPACASGTCTVTPAFTAVPALSATPAPFWIAGGAGNTTVVDGAYTLTTNGTINLAAGSPSGTYTFTLTNTLVNTY